MSALVKSIATLLFWSDFQIHEREDQDECKDQGGQCVCVCVCVYVCLIHKVDGLALLPRPRSSPLNKKKNS